MYLYPAFLTILTALSDSISAKLVMVSGLARFDSRRLHQPSLASIRTRASVGKSTFADDPGEGCPP